MQNEMNKNLITIHCKIIKLCLETKQKYEKLPKINHMNAIIKIF